MFKEEFDAKFKALSAKFTRDLPIYLEQGHDSEWVAIGSGDEGPIFCKTEREAREACENWTCIAVYIKRVERVPTVYSVPSVFHNE